MIKNTTNFIFQLAREIKSELEENAIYNKESRETLESLNNTLSIKKKINLMDLNQAMQVISTLRNRLLINKDQQELLSKTTVLFFGLSVGSHAAITWMMESRANNIIITDPDRISPSNLNRIRYGWNTVGRLKTEVVEEQIKEINPFCNVLSTTETGDSVVRTLINNNPKPNIIIDAIDDLKSKIYIRKLAQAKKIPVIMATDIGDNVMVDIERYDNDAEIKLFNGKVNDIENINLLELTDMESKKTSMQIVGLEKNSVEMLQSLKEIGKSLKTWPQLGATATIAGGILVTTIKKIILGEIVKSGRYYISLDDILVADYNSNEQIFNRNSIIQQIFK